MSVRPHSYFGIFDPARGTPREGRQGQVMFRLDQDRSWEPITPILDIQTAREILDRANRSAGAVLQQAEIKIESLELCLRVRARGENA